MLHEDATSIIVQLFDFLSTMSLNVRSVMRSILMFLFIGTFKTSTLEPGNTLTRSTVFLFSLFPVQWMFYPVNKLIGCICNCAQFFSSLPKLNYFVQEILTSEERSRFHVEDLAKNRNSLAENAFNGFEKTFRMNSSL